MRLTKISASLLTPFVKGSKYPLAARIKHDVEGEVQVQQVIRADTFDSLEKANEVSLTNAKQVSDETAKMRVGT